MNCIHILIYFQLILLWSENILHKILILRFIETCFIAQHMFYLDKILVSTLKECKFCSYCVYYSINVNLFKLFEIYSIEGFVQLFYQLLRKWHSLKCQHAGIWLFLPLALTNFASCNLKLLNACIFRIISSW